MSSHRMGRIEEDVKRCLCDIVRDLKDPRISKLLSIVRVEVSGDLSYAKVFVSAIEGEEKTAESVKGLKSAEGYIKRELNSRIRLRKIPSLNFVADNSIATGAHIAKIIEDFDYTTKDFGNED